ncbi:MAG: hypothetical protein JXA93_12595 [Anaerolineae bacterium]|nr:hypothetical protein [Anaerolineae bacterium]
MAYLAAAYAVLWAISFGLVISMVLRQHQLREELDALRLMVDDEPGIDR